MRQALLIIDAQPCFSPPPWLVEGIRSLICALPSVATVERHDETARLSSANSAGTSRRTTTA